MEGLPLKIVANALEHRLAQQPVVGDAAVLDFGEDARPDPCGFRLAYRFRQRRLPQDQRIEPLAHRAGDRLGVAAAHLAGIQEALAVAAADIQRRDLARLGAELLDERHDRKRIALDALELDPALLPSRA